MQVRRKLFGRWGSLALTLVLAFGSPLGLAQEMKGQADKKEKTKATVKNGLKPLSDEQKVAHLLDRLTFGPRPGDLDRVKKMGWQKYLDEQLHPERISDEVVVQKLKNIESANLSNQELAQYYPPPQQIRQALKAKGMDLPGTPPNEGQQPTAEDFKKRREIVQTLAEMGFKPPQKLVQELQQAKILRAVYSEKQLQEVMTDFWFNHFNVFVQKGPVRIMTTSYERDVIRPRVFGKFEDLLLATAESPAMLFYLDNWQSAAPNPQMQERFARMQMRNQNRNQADNQAPALNNAGKIKRAPRGLNENYAREIMELHTLGVDGGYTQKDVQEVARCFTGWTLRNPRGGAEFFFNPRIHDDGEKVVLGKKIPAGGGQKDGETVIKMLAQHPSTAKFISTKLARKFVSDNPPQALIDKMAQTFQKTGGDIREVLKIMFNSPEFWAPENYRSKIKTPFEMTVSAARAVNAETNGGPQFHRWIQQMGEGLFLSQPPTGYPDTAEHWVNTGALLERMNFALALSANRIPGTRVDLANLGVTTSGPAGGSLKREQVIDHYSRLLLRGELSAQSRATIEKTLSEGPADSTAQVDIAQVVGLILGSPEFQWQ